MSPRTQTPLTKWINYPNLRRRPHAPNAGRGRLQRQIARCFHVHGPEVSGAVIYDWTQTWPDGRKHYWSTKQTLCELADPIGRATTIGRPWIWRLRNF